MRKSLKDAAAEEEQLKPLLERDRKISRLEQRVRELSSKYEHAVGELESQEKRNAFLTDISGERNAESWDREVKLGTSKATAVVLASDWHVGERVDPNTVNGKNSYDEIEAGKRIKRFFHKIPVYVERYVPMTKAIVLWAGGDFITGYIHEELAESNTMSPAEECLFFRDAFNAGLKFLLKECPGRRIIIPTSYGNHGRTTLKPRASTGATNSFEWLTYKVMERDWRNEPRVEWRVGEGYHLYLDLHGRKVRGHHGDAIKFMGGVGGIHIPIRKAIAQWNKIQRVDLDFMGHHHEYVDGGYYSVNGSLIGYGAYSLKIKADFQPPSQTFLVFDGKFGVRQSTRIFVTDH